MSCEQQCDGGPLADVIVLLLGGVQVHSSNPRSSANNTQGGDLVGNPMVPASVEDAADGNKKLLALFKDPEFEESNLKHSINGPPHPPPPFPARLVSHRAFPCAAIVAPPPPPTMGTAVAALQNHLTEFATPGRCLRLSVTDAHLCRARSTT